MHNVVMLVLHSSTVYVMFCLYNVFCFDKEIKIFQSSLQVGIWTMILKHCEKHHWHLRLTMQAATLPSFSWVRQFVLVARLMAYQGPSGPTQATRCSPWWWEKKGWKDIPSKQCQSRWYSCIGILWSQFYEMSMFHHISNELLCVAMVGVC